jgi:hypothetical protein
MWFWASAALGVLLLALREEDSMRSTTNQQARMAELIRAEARRQGVDENVALAFAEVESGLDPNAVGDENWASKHDRLYRELVKEGPLASNPYANDRKLWRSYGLFQLLAPYHVQGAEDPRILLNPTVNARRGIGHIRRLGVRTQQDWNKARLLYTGATKSARAKQDQIVQRFERAMEKWA